MHPSSSASKGFTLMEIMIVMALIALLLLAGIIFLNPRKQLNLAKDTKRKGDLALMKKAIEEFYNDKNRYPRPNEVCYDSVAGATSCNICGLELASPTTGLAKYMKIPCDPSHRGDKNYLYQVNSETTPTWYRIYADFDDDNDPSSVTLGCFYGCGPAPYFAYSYGVSSQNVALETNENECADSGFLYRIVNYSCDNCSSYGSNQCPPGVQLYIDPMCRIKCH